MSTNARQIDPQSSNNQSQNSADLGSHGNEFEIIRLGKEYIEEICLIEPRCYPAPWSSNLIQGEFDKSVSLRVGIRQNGSIVAYSFNYVVADELHILNVAVVPEWRRKGIGRRLLAEILDIARNQGVRFAMLEVRISNQIARELYEAAGFRVTGRRASYYRNNGEDALIMERVL